MKYMMIACAATLAIFGVGAYASEPEDLPSFAKGGEVTWLCYSEGDSINPHDAVHWPITNHAVARLTTAIYCDKLLL